MNASSLLRAIAISAGLTASVAWCEESASSVSPVAVPITVYRQLLPDGRVLYSDKAIQGVKVDRAITIDPPIKGNLWTTEAGARPVIPPQTQHTPIDKVPSIPVPGKKKTMDDANSDVIKAEMLLEDAKQRQQAKDIAAAEAMLNKAIAARNALRNARYGQLP